MNYTKLIKEFSELCKARGFSKKGKAFSRCIGDGIYQNITYTEKYYIDTDSPEYSDANRKSPSISFGCWSMYSDIYPEQFTPFGREHSGLLSPEMIIGKNPKNYFKGFGSQYKIMVEQGLDLLDSITTQEQLLSVTYKLISVQYGDSFPHMSELAIPHIICGERNKALDRLYSIYVRSCINFFDKYRHLKESGQYDKYIEKLNEHEASIEMYTLFINRIVCNREDELKEYMLSYLERNIQYAKENKIAFADNFAPLLKK